MAEETRGHAARHEAQRAARSAGLERFARAGLLSYGLLHLLVGWLALQLAWGGGRPVDVRGADGRAADQGGALAVLAASPGGRALLGLLAVGFAGLCVWQGAEVLRHRSSLPAGGADRREILGRLGKTVATAAIFGYLAVASARAAFGAGQRGRSGEEQVVRGVLGWPGGQLLVVAVGAFVAGIGVYLVQKGARSRFVGEIELAAIRPSLRAAVHRFSQVGFVLKGVALVLVGLSVGWAAATFDPEQATGLDGALRAVVDESYGPWALTVIAAGLASFTVYCVARARHPVG